MHTRKQYVCVRVYTYTHTCARFAQSAWAPGPERGVAPTAAAGGVLGALAMWGVAPSRGQKR